MGRKKTAWALVKKDYRHTGKAYEAICRHCGCTYYPMYKNSIYCSTQCNNDAASFKKKSQGINLSNGGVIGIANPVSFVTPVNPVKVLAQGGIATKALTTIDEKIPVKLSRIGQIDIDICKERGIDLADWAEEKERLAQIRNNRGGSGFC